MYYHEYAAQFSKSGTITILRIKRRTIGRKGKPFQTQVHVTTTYISGRAEKFYTSRDNAAALLATWRAQDSIKVARYN